VVSNSSPLIESRQPCDRRIRFSSARRDFKVGFRISSQVVGGHATLIHPRSGPPIRAIVAFLVTAMFGRGLDLTVGQILAPLLNYRLMIRGLLVAIGAPPLVAFALISLIPMDEPTRIAWA
jgi:predicted Na+-dependent transporter